MMAKEYTIKEQIARVEKEIEELTEEWKSENLPPINMIWVLGTNAFPHHVDVLTCIELLTEILDEDKVKLVRERTRLEEMRTSLEEAKRQRAEIRRQAIVQGVNVMAPKI